MKKLSITLALVLVVALAAPALADNVEITGDVTTTFEVGNYGDSPAATATLWADDNVLDLDDPNNVANTGDADDFPAERAFYQEIDFNITGNVNDNTTFDLALDTLNNTFTEEKFVTVGGNQLGVQSEGVPAGHTQPLTMDTALLTIDNADYTFKVGDRDDYAVETYFVDEEDLEGAEVATTVIGHEVKAFAMGVEDNNPTDYYGVTATKSAGLATLTGKYYTVRDYDFDFDGDGTTETLHANNIALEVQADLTDIVSGNLEYVANSAEEATNSDNDVSDSLMQAGVTADLGDLTVNADLLNVGEDFTPIAWDVNGTDYKEYTVGADYALAANTTVGGSYTMEDYAVDTSDTDTIELTLSKTMGDLTTDVTLENDDVDGTKTTALTIDNEYVLSDATTVTGELVNQSGDTDTFTYVKAGVDHKLAENVNWNTTAQMITGENSAGTEGDGNSIKTELAVSF